MLTLLMYTFLTAGTIGFVQPSYTVREGVDTVAEVCFRILSPPQSQIDPSFSFVLVNVIPFEDTAQGTAIYYLLFLLFCSPELFFLAFLHTILLLS